MSAQKLEALLIDPFRREIVRIELIDPNETLLTKLLRCEAIARYIIAESEDGFQWELCCDRDSLAKLDTHPQWSFIPAAEYLQVFVPTPDHRVWIQGYGLVWGFKDGKECSFPENVGVESFASTVKCCWTDWRQVGIPEDLDALIRVFDLEPELRGRISIVPPRGAVRLPYQVWV
jgi:hypothetical protein